MPPCTKFARFYKVAKPMSVEIVDPQQAVTVSEAALRHFGEQCGGSANAAVFLSLKESGCTGYMYVLDLVSEQPEGSSLIELENGVALYLDGKALPLLQGTKIDYVRNGLNSELQFHNPNAREYCGCGESFSISEAGS